MLWHKGKYLASHPDELIISLLRLCMQMHACLCVCVCVCVCVCACTHICRCINRCLFIYEIDRPSGASEVMFHISVIFLPLRSSCICLEGNSALFLSSHFLNTYFHSCLSPDNYAFKVPHPDEWMKNTGSITGYIYIYIYIYIRCVCLFLLLIRVQFPYQIVPPKQPLLPD